MNIAFTTVLIFILLSPGFLSRIAYNSSKLSFRNFNKNILNKFAWSIIPSLTIHVLAISIVEHTTDYIFDFKQLGNLILGVTSQNKVEHNFNQLKDFIYPIFFYNLLVFIFSLAFGFGTRKIVRALNLDKKIRYLRFSNKWHYIFSGECLDFPDVPDDFEEITDKIINILCKVNNENILYTGEYFNYYVDKNGDLEAIHLKHPIRRYLRKDESKYYSIESRYLVIPNIDIVNINFRYFNKTEIDESQLSEEDKNQAIEL